jgi:radical SAM superfamily enzyme YgiQ (UPF0313 family)
MRIILLSTYDMGRQPFGLASPAAWLRKAGHEVKCSDLAVSPFPASSIQSAGLVAFHLPMHTATRLAAPLIRRVRDLNPEAKICCYGLYSSINADYLRSIGVDFALGGEFEGDLVRLAGQNEPIRSNSIIDKLAFIPPDRSSLADLGKYSKLRVLGDTRTVGYTESSRGCKHLCRHCPVVPVYRGVFRIVQHDVVLADIRQQVAAGARHITFGDPDFWNGPTHAMRIVEAMHREFPDLTFDATIKIEHLLENRELLEPLRDSGCLFVTSAVESVDDDVLLKLDKGHTRSDFVSVAEDFRRIGLSLAPTFIAFLPWTTRKSYADLLEVIRELDLVPNVSPIQLALKLLIPAGSRMLELEEIERLVTGFDQQGLTHQWRYPDEEMNGFASRIFAIAAQAQKTGMTRTEAFGSIWRETMHEDLDLVARAAIPYLDEPWYC